MSRELACLAALALTLIACAPEDGEEGPPASPTPELADGWTEILPGGRTTCARGEPFSFFVRPGSTNKVVVEFLGGGACWDETTCSVAGSLFTDSIDPIREAVAEGGSFVGIYDYEREDNPFADWFHVVVPYCTGDLHWGDNIETYGSGSSSFAINHRGAVNSRAVLDWVYDHFTGPERILSAGCSAGSYGAAVWSAYLQDHYSDSSVSQFGDSGAGVITDAFFRDSFPSWNAEEALPFWISELDPAEVDIYDLELADLYVEIGEALPELRMSQFNTTFDRTQVAYFRAMGGGSAEEWSERMIASVADIEARSERFTSMQAAGTQHCVLGAENFYEFQVGDTRVVDWLAELAEGGQPGSVTCEDCGEPAR